MSYLKYLVAICLALVGLASFASAGEGGKLVIINRTPYNFKKVYVHSYQMNHWDNEWPDVIPAGKDADVYIEWDQKCCINVNDDAGEVDYRMEGTDLQFRIYANHKDFNKHVHALFKNQLVQYYWFHDKYVYLYIGNDKNNIEFKRVY